MASFTSILFPGREAEPEIATVDYRQWHPLQRRGWLARAVESHCRAICSFALTSPVFSRFTGLRGLARYLADYADIATFNKLAADTAAVHAPLQEVGRPSTGEDYDKWQATTTEHWPRSSPAAWQARWPGVQ